MDGVLQVVAAIGLSAPVFAAAAVVLPADLVGPVTLAAPLGWLVAGAWGRRQRARFTSAVPYTHRSFHPVGFGALDSDHPDGPPRDPVGAPWVREVGVEQTHDGLVLWQDTWPWEPFRVRRIELSHGWLRASSRWRTRSYRLADLHVTRRGLGLHLRSPDGRLRISLGDVPGPVLAALREHLATAPPALPSPPPDLGRLAASAAEVAVAEAPHPRDGDDVAFGRGRGRS